MSKINTHSITKKQKENLRKLDRLERKLRSIPDEQIKKLLNEITENKNAPSNRP